MNLSFEAKIFENVATYYFILVIFLLLDNEITAEYLTAMYEANMYNGEYAFVTLDFHYDKEWNQKKWFKSDKVFEGKFIFADVFNF